MSVSQGRPLLADVAREAGVSMATASRAMTGQSGISKALAVRVREVARRLGYVANVHARSLAGGMASTIGLVVHEIGDPYFSEIASGVVRAASTTGCTVQISHAERTPESELAQVRSLRAHRVGALIIAGSGYTTSDWEQPLDAELAAYRAEGGRVVVIGRHHLAVDAVLPDNVGAGRSLGAHLRELGHRHVGVLGGLDTLNTVVDRLAGLRQGLGPGTEVVVRHGAFTREGGLEGVGALRDHPRLTAVVALNDAMAVGALRALRDRGVAVPEQVSVAGFDDISLAADLAPSLTTVRLPMADMGAQAVEIALGPPSESPRSTRTASELVVRDSTAPPRPS